MLAIKYKQTLLSIHKVKKNKQKDYFMNNDRFKFRVFYGGDYSITPYCTIDMNGKVWVDTSIMRGDGLGDFDTDIIDITDKCNVELCSGLRDINGNLIYEGDIVCENKDPYKDKYTVVFSYDDVGSCGCCVPKFDGCGFVIEDSHGARGQFLNGDCEIIGNIHE